jgi:hypothetical protein
VIVRPRDIGFVFLLLATLLGFLAAALKASDTKSWMEAFRDASSILASLSIATGMITFWIGIDKYWRDEEDRSKRNLQAQNDRVEAEKARLEEDREREIRDWQKVALHEFMHQKKGSYIKFADLLQVYQAKGGTHPRISIPKERLSSEELRRVLLEMITARIVVQNSADGYALEDYE